MIPVAGWAGSDIRVLSLTTYLVTTKADPECIRCFISLLLLSISHCNHFVLSGGLSE